MLENMFPFPSPRHQASGHISGLSPIDMTYMVIQADLFFNFLEENGVGKPVGLPDAETGIPWDVALSLLKPDELDKLKRYVTAYRAKHGSD